MRLSRKRARLLFVALVGLVVLAAGAGLSWANQSRPPGLLQAQPEAGPPWANSPHVVIQNTEELLNTFGGFDLKWAAAMCPRGEVATGGGFRVFAAGGRTVESQIQIKESVPVHSDETPDAPSGWGVVGQARQGLGHWGIGAYAVCVATPNVSRGTTS